MNRFVGLRLNSFRHFSSATVRQPRIKHKIPQKRASFLLNTLQKEELESLKNGRKFPTIRPGDSISIDKLPYMTAKEPDVIKGMVIGITRRNSDTSIRMLNVEHGTPVCRRIVMYSPLNTNIKLIKSNALYKDRRARRSKLYYLAGLTPSKYAVK